MCQDSSGDDGEWSSFPGCHHRFHVRCIMSLCLHTRLSIEAPSCPLCRHVADGLVRPKIRCSSLPQLSDMADPTREETLQAMDGRSDDTDLTVTRRTWANYLRRRRCFLLQNPQLLRATDELKSVRRDMTCLIPEMQRLFNQKCRVMWKTDEDMLELRRKQRNLRRKERRLSRVVHEQVDLVVH